MFGDNLKKLRLSRGLYQEELGEKIIINGKPVSGKTISSWEKNRTEPNMGAVQQLALFFNVSIDELMSDDDRLLDQLAYTSAGLDFVRVPLYAPISCGKGLFVDDEILGFVAVPSSGISKSLEYFAQIAQGDSMKDAGIDDGDTLIFQKSSYIDKGSIGCFCIDENDAVCKKYSESGGIITLISMNSSYEPIIIDPSQDHFVCVGKLRKIIKDVK